MVYLRLYSTLTKYLKGARIGEAVPVEVEADANVRDLIAKLGIDEGEVYLVSVNSQVEAHDYILRDGDEVSLFGPIAGGAASSPAPPAKAGTSRRVSPSLSFVSNPSASSNRRPL